MASIHPLIFIIVGAFVSITSYFMTDDKYNYSPFLYVGIIFAIYGIVKWFILDKKEKSRHKKQKTTIPKQINRDRPIYCYDCKVHMPVNYRFCPFCGKRVQ